MKGGLQIVAAPARGWCEPDTGICHVDPAGETGSAEAPAHDVPSGEHRRDSATH